MIPPGYQTVTPSLTAKDAAAALDFYVRALGATEHFRMPEPGSDRIMHAEFQIGDSRLMISSEYPEHGAVAPAFGQGGNFMIYLDDVDAAFHRAAGEGATVITKPADQFWGDRIAKIADPHGYRWTLATHLRDVSEEEMMKAAAEWNPEST